MCTIVLASLSATNIVPVPWLYCLYCTRCCDEVSGYSPSPFVTSLLLWNLIDMSCCYKCTLIREVQLCVFSYFTMLYISCSWCLSMKMWMESQALQTEKSSVDLALSSMATAWWVLLLSAYLNWIGYVQVHACVHSLHIQLTEDGCLIVWQLRWRTS